MTTTTGSDQPWIQDAQRRTYPSTVHLPELIRAKMPPRLEALSAYLQHQRTLLARTQADIERLKKLKAEALASPEQFANRSNFQVSRFLHSLCHPIGDL